MPAILSMFAGAQCVHVLYKPLDDLDSLTEQELKERLGQQGKEQQKNVVQT